MMNYRLTPAVKTILFLSLGLFVFQQVMDRWLGGHVLSVLGLRPSGFLIHFHVWQIFTYSLLHGDVTHLVLNALMLVVIGSELEMVWGTAKFVRYYLASIIFAGFSYIILQLIFWQPDSLAIPLIGASGGVYGLLVAYGILFSERTLLFMMLFPMKAKVFVWVLAGVEFFTTVFTPGGGLSGIAHLGGMLGGFLFLLLSVFLKQRITGLKRMAKSKGKAPHLKLVVTNTKTPKKDFLNQLFKQGDSRNDPKTWH
ncbi:MAG: rhomboid family intramembrane serine protease [Xanthomonadaceae bacterium]|nr:rhomboid family intramembrane serine protease [Xanthomonadaceae bacterium]